MRKIFPLFLCVCGLSTLCAKAPDKPFTEMETLHVRVQTPGLFSQSNKLTLNLKELKDDDFAFPLPGAKIISGYGIHGGRSSHSGIDIKTKAKDTIYCAFDGRVRMSKSYGGYGNVIVVRHKSGLETLYSHNFKNFVKSGDKVSAGQAIGLTGRTGRATTEHLHFETRLNGEHFNPNIIFNVKENTLRKACIQCIKSSKGIIVKPLK
ncbi:MAG: M23 family metallopeptidase [Bacteroides sp.]